MIVEGFRPDPLTPELVFSSSEHIFKGPPFQLITGNPDLKLVMSVVPLLSFDMRNRYMNAVEVYFFWLGIDTGGLDENVFIIGTGDISQLDVREQDFWEEVGPRYAEKFRNIKDFDSYSHLLAQVFPDIIEARQSSHFYGNS